jgi:Initiation factor 2 subunit family.
VRVRVIVDSAVRYFMKDVDRVIVGATPWPPTARW